MQKPFAMLRERMEAISRARTSLLSHHSYLPEMPANSSALPSLPSDAFAAEKPTGRRWECAAASDTLYAGYPHFHFYSNLEFLYSFYDACIKEKHRHDGKY